MSPKITPNVEDYLKAIYRIEAERGVARVKEISIGMKVTYPSTSGILKKMESMALVEHERYGYVKLSEEGRKLAQEIIRREEILTNFFTRVLHLTEEDAITDACRIEHMMKPETARRFLAFLEFSYSQEKQPGDFVEAYHKHLETIPPIDADSTTSDEDGNAVHS